MKHFIHLAMFATLGLACSGSDRTEVSGEMAETLPSSGDAVLIDEVEWNGERLAFYDAPSEDGTPGVVLAFESPAYGPELITTLDQQLRRVATAAEIWLAVGGTFEDLPAELVAAHELQAREEGRGADLERPEIDASLVEKTVTQARYNVLFDTSSGVTGVLPSQPGQPATPVCWDADVSEQNIGFSFGAKRVCSGGVNGAIIGPFNQFGQPQNKTNCDVAFNVNATVRTVIFTPNQPNGNPQAGTQVVQCFASGSATETCTGPTLMGSGKFLGQSFFKNGTAHRLGTGGFLTAANNFVDLGAGTLKLQVPAFGASTCTSH